MSKKLGELLVEAGTINSQQLLLALIEQKKINRPLGMTLVQMGFVDETILIKVLADQLSLPLVRLRGKRISSELLDLVPPDQAEKHRCLPLLLKNAGGVPTLYVAMEDPGDAEAIAELGRLCERKIRPVLAAPSELQDALARHYTWAPTSDGAVCDPSTSDPAPAPDPVPEPHVGGEPDPLAGLDVWDMGDTGSLDDLDDLDDSADLDDPDDAGSLADLDDPAGVVGETSELAESGDDLDLGETAPDICDAEAEEPSAAPDTGPGDSGTSSEAVLRALTQILVEKEIITREELVARLASLAAESSEEIH